MILFPVFLWGTGDNIKHTSPVDAKEIVGAFFFLRETQQRFSIGGQKRNDIDGGLNTILECLYVW